MFFIILYNKILKADRNCNLTRKPIQLFSAFFLMDMIRGLIMKKLTQARLKELFHYNSETGIFTRRIKTNRSITIGSIAGYKTPINYIQITINKKIYFAHRLAWFYIYGYFPENGIDHINKNKSDNRIKNLRVVSNQCNMRNTGNPKNNTSGIKGVCWDKRGKQWQSQIKMNQKSCFLGIYKSFINAVCARLAGEQSLNWSGCDSNSPAYKFVQKNIQGGK